MINKPIPNVKEPGIIKDIEISHSPFIKVTENDFLVVRMQYPLLHCENAISDCYMRKEVYEQLEKASKLLPKGYKFVIWDAYRPFALQNELYIVYKAQLIEKFNLHHLSDEEIDNFVKKYISLPHKDPLLPPVHTTGGAIDVTLIDENGKELDMGTGFDEFTDRTTTNYYEDKDDIKIRNNRRLLYNIMISVGFTNLPSEWWHYDYYDRFYGYYNKKPAYYEGVFTLKEVENYK